MIQVALIRKIESTDPVLGGVAIVQLVASLVAVPQVGNRIELNYDDPGANYAWVKGVDFFINLGCSPDVWLSRDVHDAPLDEMLEKYQQQGWAEIGDEITDTNSYDT